jgi:hypothetical protein
MGCRDQEKREKNKEKEEKCSTFEVPVPNGGECVFLIDQHNS